MEFLTLDESTRLDTLPLDVLLIILNHLNTARSVARLGTTSRRLREAVKVDGWRSFVRSHFGTLRLPPNVPDDEWQVLAKTLTWQSRAWERHALTVDSFIPHKDQQPRGARGGGDRRQQRPAQRTQTFPCQIIVDASSRKEGKSVQETVVWGAGEDIFARCRNTAAAAPHSETWHSLTGAQNEFKPGKDDVTSISILDQETQSKVVVGRASGDLRLLSLDPANFGQTHMSFQPSTTEDVRDHYTQNEIQALDFDRISSTLAASTKGNVFLYNMGPLECDKVGTEDGEEGHISVKPRDAFDVHSLEGSTPFKTIRCMRFTANGDIALGLTSSTQPLRYLTLSPTGPRLDAASKILPSGRATDVYALKDWTNATVRGLLPIDAASIAGGKGNVVLSSYEDGTIRLQDMRSPSPVDTIFQDNFEVMTPSGALLAYGTERFIAGNARSNTVKIFDFRWNKAYLHTASLPCRSETPYPSPRPPTLTKPPSYPERGCCDHVRGHECTWHALSKESYYRPNYTVYLPMINTKSSPVYSLAKSSDTSPTLYAGLAGELVEMNLREESGDLRRRPNAPGSKPLYACRRGLASILETGDGFSLPDISKSQRVPEMRTQSKKVLVDSLSQSVRSRHRLDEHLQLPQDFPAYPN
ncbi:hypothetical protein PG988_000892 [Apiospora saccharicola]